MSKYEDMIKYQIDYLKKANTDTDKSKLEFNIDDKVMYLMAQQYCEGYKDALSETAKIIE